MPRINKGRRVLKFGPGKSQELLNRAADPKTFFLPFMTNLDHFGDPKKNLSKVTSKKSGTITRRSIDSDSGSKKRSPELFEKVEKGSLLIPMF